MSWKLAELSWRQELGLYESRWERQSGAVSISPIDPVVSKNDGRGRLRSRSGATRYRLSNAACEPGGGLGAPQTHRLSTGPHSSISPSPSTHHLDTIASTVPLLRSFNNALFTTEAQEDQDEESGALSAPATRSRSCSALGSHPPQDLSLPKFGIECSPAVEPADRCKCICLPSILWPLTLMVLISFCALQKSASS